MINIRVAYLKKLKAPRLGKAKVVITREDFNREYVGFSAAIEWIARANLVLPGKNYIIAIHNTLSKLIDLLRNPEPGLTIEIEGINSEAPQLGHKRIDPGIWSSVSISDKEIGNKPYALSLIDDESEWGGSLIGISGNSFRQLRMKSETALKLAAHLAKGNKPAEFVRTVQRTADDHELDTCFKSAVLSAPTDLLPFSLAELETLGRACFPDTKREKIREIAKKNVEMIKRGPRGPRNPQRKQMFNEFLKDFSTAKLQN